MYRKLPLAALTLIALLPLVALPLLAEDADDPTLSVARPIPIVMRDVPPEEDPVAPEGNRVLHDLRTGLTTRVPMVEPLPGELTEFVEGKQGEAPLYVPPKSAPQPNFGLYDITPDPTSYPYSAHVRLEGWYVVPGLGDTINYMASGTLIDPYHVLTAGHCVYIHDYDLQLEDGSWISYVVDHWADYLEVVPAYTNGIAPFGKAVAASYSSWEGWTDDEDYDHDVAVIRLDRPIGARTGWRGYAWSNDCDKFTSGTWYHHCYPAEGYNYDSHLMRTNVGTFDGCDDFWGSWYGNEVWAERPSYGGTSGGGAMKNGKVYAVRSNTSWAGYEDYDAFDTRVTSSKYWDIRAWLLGYTPDVPALYPVDFHSPLLTRNPGDYLDICDVLVHNYSEADFTGTVEIETYLSADSLITTSDVLLGSFTTSQFIESLGSVRVNIPGWRVPGDTPAGDYYLGARIRGSVGDTSWRSTPGEDCDVLWINCDSLDEMEYLEPAYATSCLDTVVTLRWVHQSPVSHYYVRVGPDCNSYILLTNTTNNSITVDGLERGRTYYWKVQPVNGCIGGVKGPWGPCYSFHTAGAAPDTVKLVGPTDGQECLDHVEVMLDWEDDPQAEFYHVQFGDACESGSIEAATTSALSKTGLNRGETYFWRVRGRSACGENGPWSECRSFTTREDGLPAPAHVSPADDALCKSLTSTTLRWDPVQGAVSYQVHMGAVSNCYTYPDTVVTTTATAITPPLRESNTTYYWIVLAEDSCGALGDYEPSWAYTTEGFGPAPPANGDPGVTRFCSSSDIHLQWSKVGGAVEYQVEILGLPSPFNTSNTYYDLSGFPDATYQWRVRAKNSCTYWGPFSDWWSFDVESQPPGVPLNLASTTHTEDGWSNLNRIMLEWDAAMEDCGMDGYSIAWGLDGTPRFPPDSLVDTTGLGYRTDPVYDHSVGWYAFVRAIDEAGHASPAYATAGPFLIDTVPPQAQMLKPNGGENLVGKDDYVVRWFAADDRSGLAEVRLDYSTDGGVNWSPVTTKTIDPATNQYLWEVPEDYSTEVLVRVTAVDSAGSECADRSDGRCAITSQTGVGDPSAGRRLALLPNYPNPFRSSTQIQFQIPEEGHVSLVVYDAAGRVVRRLVDEWRSASAVQVVSWDGRDEAGGRVSSGIYYYCLDGAGRRLTRKMIFVR